MLVAVALVVLAISLFTIFYVLAGGALPWERTVTKEQLISPATLPGTAGSSAGSRFA